MMKRLYRNIVFFFRYRGTMHRAEGSASFMNYPLMILLQFGRPKLKALYMKSGNYQEALMVFLEDEEKRRDRILYKLDRRMKMQSEPSFDYEEWEERVARWRHHLEISAAIKLEEEYGKTH